MKIALKLRCIDRFFLFSSTINPILYNVMSHRYRIAFRETLCSRKRWTSNGNGFSRDQSSFRETTIAVAGRDQSENSRLVSKCKFRAL